MEIGVIGGGITGLSIAYYLSKMGYSVTVYEKNQPGGLASGIPMPGLTEIFIDKYYHHIFKSDANIIRLIHEMGLASDLEWHISKSGLYANGKLWSLESSFDLLFFSPMGSIWQRFLMGWNLFYFRNTSDWKKLDTIRCSEFFKNRYNEIGFKNFWEPLLKQKFADGFDNISAAFLWGRIYPRARSRSRGKETLGYLKGGFQRLIIALIEAIKSNGGKVLPNTPVQEVVIKDRPCVILRDGKKEFDRLVWTISTTQLPKLISNATMDIKEKAISIDYIAVTCLMLIMKRQQGEFYWLNNIDPNISFGALIEHTNFIPPENYNGKHILYVVNYHKQDDSLSFMNTNEVFNYHTPSIQKIYPCFNPKDVEEVYLFRNLESSPLYDIKFSKRIPPYQGWLRNIDICNMTQVYPEDRNMNNCVKNALSYISTEFKK